jgi:ribonuclease HI
VYDLYADGSASHITRTGGWAFIIQSDEGLIAQDAGWIPETTNNQMEIIAIIEGLKSFGKRFSHVFVYSDSAYVVNTMNNKWWEEWQKNNWKKHDGKPTPNKEQWQELIALVGKHDVEFVKVKAHDGDTLNERCDKLAKEARKFGHPLWVRDFTEIE